MHKHEKINYVEFPARDLEATNSFFAAAFGWSFADYGPEYAAFSDQGLDGGFYKSSLAASAFPGGRRFQFEGPSGTEFAVWGESKG